MNVEATDELVFVLGGRSYTDFTLKEFEERFPSDRFVRTHPSSIVNLEAVYEFVPP